MPVNFIMLDQVPVPSTPVPPETTSNHQDTLPIDEVPPTPPELLPPLPSPPPPKTLFTPKRSAALQRLSFKSKTHTRKPTLETDIRKSGGALSNHKPSPISQKVRRSQPPTATTHKLPLKPPREVKPSLLAKKEEFRMREASISEFLSGSSVLDAYKVLSHLGKGSFSVVSLAVDRQTQQRMAIKTYSKIDEMADYKFDNIYREINNLKELAHQNIIGLRHVIQDKRKLLLVMENGGALSLAGLLRKNRVIPEPMAKEIFRQLAQGIFYCHSQGVCHRDLKLENVLVDSANRVKIIDFGFSAKCGRRLKTYCGTPPYMAPQITYKAPYFGQGVDMWALGVMLYLVLFGKFPFRANSEKELYHTIQIGRFDMLDGVSPQAKETIRKLLTVKVEDRITAGKLVECAWLRKE